MVPWAAFTGLNCAGSAIRVHRHWPRCPNLIYLLEYCFTRIRLKSASPCFHLSCLVSRGPCIIPVPIFIFESDDVPLTDTRSIAVHTPAPKDLKKRRLLELEIAEPLPKRAWQSPMRIAINRTNNIYKVTQALARKAKEYSHQLLGTSIPQTRSVIANRARTLANTGFITLTLPVQPHIEHQPGINKLSLSAKIAPRSRRDLKGNARLGPLPFLHTPTLELRDRSLPTSQSS